MLDERFSHHNLVNSPERESLLEALRIETTRRLQATSDPANEGYSLVEELRRLGHDLWSFDEDDDFQIWCGSWTARKHPWELILYVNFREDEIPHTRVEFVKRPTSNP